MATTIRKAAAQPIELDLTPHHSLSTQLNDAANDLRELRQQLRDDPTRAPQTVHDHVSDAIQSLRRAGMYQERIELARAVEPLLPPAGAHRRSSTATDAALCAYRDDAEAIHGTYYYGKHAGPVSMPGGGLGELARCLEPSGRLAVSRELNGRS